MHQVKIAPSILSANFAILGQEIINVTNAGADYIHIDIMDGHFVPNLTFGPKVVSDIRPFTKVPFDVHLMTRYPDNLIEQFALSGADIITVHLESVIHLHRTISLIRSFNKKVGISLVPTTSPDNLDCILEYIDLVLVMTVNPGFSGQLFIDNQLQKIEVIKKKIEKINKNIAVEVDGGINKITAAQVIAAGADILVSGSYIFGVEPDLYQEKINSLRYAR